MKGINKATIVGNVGATPETNQLTGGGLVTKLSLATTERWQNKSGQQEERTEWHRVEFFGRLAEIARDYVRKGEPLYIEGKIVTEKWQDSNGNDRYTTKIKGRELQLLTQRHGKAANDSRQPNHQARQPPAPVADFADDIPF